MCVQTWAWDIPVLQIPNREEVVCLQIFLKMQDCLPFHRFDATSLANQWTVKASSTETCNEVYSPAKQKELVQHRKPRPNGLQKLFGLEILCAASQPWIIWGRKKNEKRRVHASFQLPFLASLQWPHLWLLAWTQKVCERRAKGGHIDAQSIKHHKTTKEKGGFAALPPPCLWNAWRPKLSITGNCSCFCPSPLWPSNALGTIYMVIQCNTWYNHSQGHRRRLSKWAFYTIGQSFQATSSHCHRVHSGWAPLVVTWAVEVWEFLCLHRHVARAKSECGGMWPCQSEFSSLGGLSSQ